VHYGGRRKEHEFRALYDYYGKRLDYGDGDFPCKWPSEVMQDEVHGWMLRVAPVRDPIAIHGAWEEYSEETPSGGPRIFYFNRDTFEASYDVPDDVHALKYASTAALGSTTQESYGYVGYQYNATSSQFGNTAEGGQVVAITDGGGYYDENGQWVYGNNGNGNAGSAIADGGYYDENGNWVYSQAVSNENGSTYYY
jgi:hypothetical protein